MALFTREPIAQTARGSAAKTIPSPFQFKATPDIPLQKSKRGLN